MVYIAKKGVKLMDPEKRVEIEAATFRHLVNYLRENTDVQNIDLMNLAGFCRNCISKWYKAEAEKEGIKLEYEDAREIIYGMPYADWKEKYQSEASQEQIDTYNKNN